MVAPTAPSKLTRVMIFATVAIAVIGAVSLIAIITPRKPDVSVQLATAQSLLDSARANSTVPPTTPDILLPIPDVSDPGHRKTLFIAALLPIIVRENTRIEDQRARAKSAPLDSPEYAALAYAYGVSPDMSRQGLLSHIDIIPVSLTLAQGALESAWGTSRFAREGNAYFGQRTFDDNADGMTPKDRPQSAFKVKSFPSAALSVRAFMKTLNTHPAYQALRDARAAIRKSGRQPTGLALVPYLHRYSTIGDAYIRRVTVTIKTNDLQHFNAVKLRRN